MKLSGFLCNKWQCFLAKALCCFSEELDQNERVHIHFYFAIKAIIHKITKGDAPYTAQMNDKVRKMIEVALISDDVEEVFKLDKNNPLNNADIFSDKYMANINKIQ